MSTLVEKADSAPAVTKVTETINNLDEMRELFLWRFKDVDRAKVMVMYKQFVKFDPKLTGEISEREAAMMFEKRGSVKTATEIRSIVEAMDTNKDHKLNFVEWCCAYFKKDFAELNNFVDETARESAIKEAMIFGKQAKQVEEEIEKARLNKEVQAQLRAAAIERESKLTGVMGMKAFFARKAEGTVDCTKTNEQQIKEEAARRKALREAKEKLNNAINRVDQVKSAEEVALEIKLKAERLKQEEEEAERKKAADEVAARSARKAELNKMWGSPGPASMKD